MKKFMSQATLLSIMVVMLGCESKPDTRPTKSSEALGVGTPEKESSAAATSETVSLKISGLMKSKGDAT
jgi:hypothetical protein